MEETFFNDLPRTFGYTSGTTDVIRVVLVDSREAMREGLRQMLSGDESIKVIGEATNAKEAISQIQKLYPDIVILDADVKGTDGTKIINHIKQSLRSVGIIVLNDDISFLVPIIESGAACFMTRDIDRNQLVSAIRIVYLWRSILFQDANHFSLVKL